MMRWLAPTLVFVAVLLTIVPARAQRPSVGNGAWAMPALGRVLVASETEAGVDAALAELIENERFNLNCVVSCARSKDCPIVYASDGFYELTG